MWYCIASLARVKALFKLSNWIVEVLSLAYKSRSHWLTQDVRTHLTLTFLA